MKKEKQSQLLKKITEKFNSMTEAEFDKMLKESKGKFNFVAEIFELEQDREVEIIEVKDIEFLKGASTASDPYDIAKFEIPIPKDQIEAIYIIKKPRGNK